ncbi:MAG: zinc metallopeptidase [Candidatus Riflebacteria bacterium]|nr:zinc metallopeptidase [Candidatus Riflebacteria bacterium]
MAFDSTYILVIIGAIISMIASWNVQRTFKNYSNVANSQGFTSQDIAQRILSSAGINDVRIERISGNLTDHYSPSEKVLRLSDTVYGSTSVAALGVAAHECGHAIQHKVGYSALKLRSMAVPLANFGSTLAWPIIIAGIAMSWAGLAQFGVILFCFVVFFQLITLPVEFNASSRALEILQKDSILAGGELQAAKKVLSAAALTYVAALVSSVLQLLRLIMITKGSRRR